ncbi:hypothetical protein AAJ76_1670001420 [Vairimorpha ceranae]|uniref:Uncharacterized protein n=1 Tax=Vairimorpha ceranae TaxID=40302 RepID=A0A0F9Z7N8_9MICR|nr:hypothetical protein AAJ76_1670001420 [Vairimorpha ceranae]KKO73939.1 hypothetical protein AAJ76_1670001420 [Vairimorpha ceranae]
MKQDNWKENRILVGLHYLIVMIYLIQKKINADPQIGSIKLAVELKKIVKKTYIFDVYEIICVK